MALDARAEARTTLALAGAAKASVASGLTFVAPEALAARARAADRHPLGAVCASLSLDFAFVAAGSDDAADAAESVRAAGAAVMWSVAGPLGRLLEERGWTEGLRSVAGEPEALVPLLDDGVLAALEGLERGTAAGASVLVIAEDLAGTTGPLVPPDYAFEELFPRLARIVEAAREADLPCVLHSDGDVRAFLPAAKRSGFSAVHVGGGLGWQAFEQLFRAARTAGLAVVGSLLTTDISRGAPGAVAAGSRAGVLASAGGLLLADDGGLATPEELDVFVSALAAARAAVASAGEGAR
ncbi:MAG: hypothetical protein C0418_01370 [Coriobacteriaceae bacterium]|nr:hypothetical protein [Coriobacteriaceae bacterium]